MYVVLIDLRKSNLPILTTNSSKLSLKQSVSLTDVSNYCEPQKIKLFIYIYLKISRNLGSNFMDFWQFLVTFGISVRNFPAFYEHNRARPIPEVSRENLSLVD